MRTASLIRGQDPARFKLTLTEAIEKHGLYSQAYGKAGAVQVFSRLTASAARARAADWDLHHLTDYIVSSTASGPSLVLVSA